MQQQSEPPVRSAAPGRLGRLATALVAGLIGGLVAPLFYPALARNARPVSRKAMKAGIAAFERSREIAAEWGEHASDLMAEARAEYDEEQKSPGVESGTPGNDIVRLRGSGRETATS
ncbi:MAG: DUF5132 domain-containing protein [Alphaproteobacteria bacterium]|nr:DUF5132 domain-containing protein [Alphaproteobacteria bacterium]